MTTRFMQDIIQIENELHANEKAEHDRAAAWLKGENTSIQQEHQKQLDALEEESGDVRDHARKEAEKNAAERVRLAGEEAKRLDNLHDDLLCRCLKEHLPAIITGKYT